MLANAVQGHTAGLQAGRLGGRPATSTSASFVWTRAVSGCHAAHDEVSVGNCPREASTSQGVMVEGGRTGVLGADRERNDTRGSSHSLSFSFLPSYSLLFSFLAFSALYLQLHLIGRSAVCLAQTTGTHGASSGLQEQHNRCIIYRFVGV